MPGPGDGSAGGGEPGAVLRLAGAFRPDQQRHGGDWRRHRRPAPCRKRRTDPSWPSPAGLAASAGGGGGGPPRNPQNNLQRNCYSRQGFRVPPLRSGGGGPRAARWRGRQPDGGFAPLPACGRTPPATQGESQLRFAVRAAGEIQRRGAKRQPQCTKNRLPHRRAPGVRARPEGLPADAPGRTGASHKTPAAGTQARALSHRDAHALLCAHLGQASPASRAPARHRNRPSLAVGDWPLREQRL
jgi:hypothetical protein